MKKSMSVVLCVAVCLLTSQVFGAFATIKGVEIVQASGVQADYYVVDTQTGVATLRWSQGATGVLLTDDFSNAFFDQVSVTATFTGLTDLSENGIAKATFDTATWSIDLGVTGQLGVVHLGGTLAPGYKYTEEEAANPGTYAQKLDGSALVTVDSAYFSLTYFQTLWGAFNLELDWANENGLGALFSSVLFLPGENLVEDYSSDYSSDNVTVTLLADTTGVIPEPATLAILGLGSLLVARRRRA